MSDRTKQILEATRDWPLAEIEDLVNDLQQRLHPEPEATWNNPHASKEEVTAWLRSSAGVGLPGVTTESIMRETREA